MKDSNVDCRINLGQMEQKRFKWGALLWLTLAAVMKLQQKHMTQDSKLAVATVRSSPGWCPATRIRVVRINCEIFLDFSRQYSNDCVFWYMLILTYLHVCNQFQNWQFFRLMFHRLLSLKSCIFIATNSTIYQMSHECHMMGHIIWVIIFLWNGEVVTRVWLKCDKTLWLRMGHYGLKGTDIILPCDQLIRLVIHWFIFCYANDPMPS